MSQMRFIPRNRISTPVIQRFVEMWDFRAAVDCLLGEGSGMWRTMRILAEMMNKIPATISQMGIIGWT